MPPPLLTEEVATGEVIALSGNTGYSPTPHLHFDAVKVLPQETSELWIVHPSVLPLPSVAAIFSGPLNREVENFTAAPMQKEEEEEAREWKRGEMLYRAKTLPVC
ncbi:hypothetical protein Esi_0037_0051 [Ectocarpus siliculosus]|uniref:Peptidase M23 domain-containing protein n=1 Tax=Ectocarpus siliculosus TaxID=2880 RepID=D8LLL6_ECTSI|nr:hypothetical protein Esi_0037_0051 [Ectocarpus siliculosus]|eukprot:CBN74647.1 hypothetical protein Esi_0037_0051 [Ectocarpus siliculosus]